MREKYNGQLEDLHQGLIFMGELCQQAITMASRCLTEYTPELAANVRHLEEEIDHKERSIEALCMRLLLLQQPVAQDLRNVSSALKMISDMERIGDQAADIAEIMQYVSGKGAAADIPISQMAETTGRMVKNSIDSFVQSDLEAAQAVIGFDDVVDQQFLTIKEKLTQELLRKPEEAEACLDLLMIAKYFERIGDHATNIAEWVVFAIRGSHEDR